MLRRMLLLVPLVLLTTVSFAFAQGSTFGLSSQDFDFFNQALTANTTLTSFQFEYTLDFAVTGVDTGDISVNLQGTGAYDANGASPALQLALLGTANAPNATPVDAEIRLIDDILYVTALDPSTGERSPWEGMSLGDLAGDVAGETPLAGLGPQGDVSLDTTELSPELASALAAFDPSDFISISRLADEAVNGDSAAHYSISVSLSDLGSSAAFTQVLSAAMSAADPASVDAASMQSIGPMMAMLFADSSVQADLYYGTADQLLRRVALVLDVPLNGAALGMPQSVSFSLNLDITLTDHNQPQTIVVPEGAEIVSGTSEIVNSEPVMMLPTATPAESSSDVPGAASGQTIVANTPVTVTLSGSTPVDLSYAGSSGEEISVSARSLEASGALDTTLEVLGANGVRLAFNDDHGGAGTGLATFDSFISALRLRSNETITIRVSSFGGSSSGRVEVTVLSGQSAAATSTPQNTTSEQGGVITGVVPDNDSFDYSFSAQAGDVVTIAVRATDNVLDPKVALLDASGQTLTQNDDHGTDDTTLARFDSLISEFVIPSSGTYTARITGFAGTGGAFEMTLDLAGGGTSVTPTTPTTESSQPLVMEIINDSIQPSGSFEYTLNANAGDVYTFTVRAGSRGDLDPQVIVYDPSDDLLFGNDDHGTSDRTLGAFDARIFNLIMPESGRYTVLVAGYRETSGDFELTIEQTGTDAPLTRGTDQTFTGEIRANGTFSQTFEAQAGDYVTISVRAEDEGFDPRLQLLSPDAVVVADNDDHGTAAQDLSFLDSRIHNFHVTESGTYTVQVQGYRDSAGAFTVIVSTLR